MKKYTKIIVLCVILLASLVLSAQGGSKKIVMLFGDYPPFYMGVKDDATTQVKKGMFIDFLNQFEKEWI